MRILARHFEVIGPHDVPAAAVSRGRSVLLTFDDGYRDNYELAFPVLKRRGLQATFFVTTGFLDQPRVPWWDELAWMVQTSRSDVIAGGEWLPGELRLTPGNRRGAIRALDKAYKSLPGHQTEEFLDFCGSRAGTGRCDPALGAELWMTWAMAAEMRDAGMSIGGHTVNHPVLARLSHTEQQTEVAECRRRIEQELRTPMEVFAYPVGLPGTFDARTRACLEREGVRIAFSFGGGRPRRHTLDRLAVPRAGVTGASPEAFRAMLAVPGVFARW
jgi:peptidoglycan/xylan/chitin deacetylase (PgdA/CDA1 family)